VALPRAVTRGGDAAHIWRCRWPKRTVGGAAAAPGESHFAEKRFHSKTCAQRWFERALQPIDASFGGNRQLYQHGQNRRALDEFTPLTRRAGNTWSRLGHEHANTAAGSLSRATQEWNDLLINFPGMQPHAFIAHLDAAGGHWTSHIPRAPKFTKLVELIDAQEDGDKFLVFSQSQQLLELVAGALAGLAADYVAPIEVDERVIVTARSFDAFRDQARGTVTSWDEDSWDERERVIVRLDGDGGEWSIAVDQVRPVPFFVWAKDGEEAMALFRDEPGCCGLLLESGNFAAGLTLTVANTCFVLEPQLDAAVQAQLEARIHRPGQTRVANIVHLYTPGTIEERIVRRERADEA